MHELRWKGKYDEHLRAHIKMKFQTFWTFAWFKSSGISMMGYYQTAESICIVFAPCGFVIYVGLQSCGILIVGNNVNNFVTELPFAPGLTLLWVGPYASYIYCITHVLQGCSTNFMKINYFYYYYYSK